jgi:hypothetical protein
MYLRKLAKKRLDLQVERGDIQMYEQGDTPKFDYFFVEKYLIAFYKLSCRFRMPGMMR